MNEIKPQHMRFVLEYERLNNATQAAIAAGYSKKTAASQGSRLLKHADVRKEMKRRLSTVVMSVDEVLLLVARETTHHDPTVRLRAMDMLLKAGGAYVEERKISGSITLADKTPGPKKRSIQ